MNPRLSEVTPLAGQGSQGEQTVWQQKKKQPQRQLSMYVNYKHHLLHASPSEALLANQPYNILNLYTTPSL